MIKEGTIITLFDAGTLKQSEGMSGTLTGTNNSTMNINNSFNGSQLGTVAGTIASNVQTYEKKGLSFFIQPNPIGYPVIGITYNQETGTIRG